MGLVHKCFQGLKYSFEVFVLKQEKYFHKIFHVLLLHYN